MKKSVLCSSFVALGMSVAALVSVRADSVLLTSSGWNSLADGASLTAPWSQQYGGGTTPGVSSVKIATLSSEKWALIDNAASNESASNPSLQGNFVTFSSTTDTLSITFDYVIPANYGAGSQIQFTLNQYVSGTTTNAITIGLGRNYQINGLYYIDASGTKQSVGHTFSAGERVTISLTNISLDLKTYDFSWSTTANGGASGSVSDIAIRNAGSVSSLSYLSIGDNSAVAGTSQIYINDFTVTSVSSIPEPSTLALLSGCIVLGSVCIRRRAR